ncbi:hypothetical protein E2542_SST12508 [Spatholobus suberectus]|nr:hypothetical protein E2542_SST12508 [Spatholobus suberectus]
MKKLPRTRHNRHKVGSHFKQAMDVEVLIMIPTYFVINSSQVRFPNFLVKLKSIKTCYSPLRIILSNRSCQGTFRQHIVKFGSKSGMSFNPGEALVKDLYVLLNISLGKANWKVKPS